MTAVENISISKVMRGFQCMSECYWGFTSTVEPSRSACLAPLLLLFMVCGVTSDGNGVGVGGLTLGVRSCFTAGRVS